VVRVIPAHWSTLVREVIAARSRSTISSARCAGPTGGVTSLTTTP
jgi:hypothetical protein